MYSSCITTREMDMGCFIHWSLMSCKVIHKSKHWFSARCQKIDCIQCWIWLSLSLDVFHHWKENYHIRTLSRYISWLQNLHVTFFQWLKVRNSDKFWPWLTFSSKISYILQAAFNIRVLFESTITIFHFPGGCTALMLSIKPIVIPLAYLRVRWDITYVYA